MNSEQTVKHTFFAPGGSDRADEGQESNCEVCELHDCVASCEGLGNEDCAVELLARTKKLGPWD